MNSVFNRSVAVAVVVMLTASTFALAQDYPAKTITFIVPYAAGGSGVNGCRNPTKSGDALFSGPKNASAV